MAQKMLIVRSLPCPITVGCSAYVNLLFLPYLVGLSVVLIVSTRKPVNNGFSGISGEWNISDASVGTEELNHLEMIGAIVYQLTKDLTEDEIKEQGFGDYFVDHTTGIFPQAAAGFPYTAASMQVKGDPITDLHESMAAEQKARTTYDNILRFCDDYDVKDPIRFLRAREVVHYQRFGENLRLLTDKLNEKNFYAFNPSFDKKCFKNELKKKK